MQQSTILNTIEPYCDTSGNRISGTPTLQRNVKVFFKAKNCELEVAEGVTLTDVAITFYCDSAKVIIGERSHYKGAIFLGLNSTVKVGQKLTVTRNCYISSAEGSSVTIGNDCMIAKEVEIRAEDSHPIFDLETGRRINPSRSINIGNHVWLAEHSAVLSGSVIEDGSVLGFRSVLKGQIPPNSLAVGIPAKVVKTGIRWERTHLSLSAPFYFPGSEAGSTNPA